MLIGLDIFITCVFLSLLLGLVIGLFIAFNDSIEKINENFKYLGYENLLKENKELKEEIKVLKRIVKGHKK